MSMNKIAATPHFTYGKTDSGGSYVQDNKWDSNMSIGKRMKAYGNSGLKNRFNMASQGHTGAAATLGVDLKDNAANYSKQRKRGVVASSLGAVGAVGSAIGSVAAFRRGKIGLGKKMLGGVAAGGAAVAGGALTERVSHARTKQRQSKLTGGM